MTKNFDVVVIGGGHAGCEAAHASAKIGMKTALLVTRLDTIARMSCNPAIGGPGKSQIVREVDALGGLMARVIDSAGIQYRTLNAGKGAAVRANRVQADTTSYEKVMRKALDRLENLTLVEGQAVSIEAEGKKVSGVFLHDGGFLCAKAVIVCTGTFLNAILHFGMEQKAGGRYGEQASARLSDSLIKLGFTLGRLKTGTPPRLDKNSINFSKLEIQHGDEPPQNFSFFTPKINRMQMPCHLTHTNARTHAIIRGALDKSPLYAGAIKGVGPRYCPSIEDKIVKFPDRDSHHIFLEPIAVDSAQMYPNGISTSMPEDVQSDFVRSIQGFENAKILCPGYAVEYDFAPPTQIFPTLETKLIEGLYFAGQINGTSGYEEAAGQGILAGINSARKIAGAQPVVLKRSESYIGVMVDDLTTLGTDEPYRMFTSRAEYRLTMRQDNADVRLCPLGRKIGLLGEEDYQKFLVKQKRVNLLVKRFKTSIVIPTQETLSLLEKAGLPKISEALPLARYIRRPEVTVKHGAPFGDFEGFSEQEIECAETEIKYEGYIKRQRKWIKEFSQMENIRMDGRIADYSSVPGLSNELRRKLEDVRPLTLGQASRISGITPAALSILMVYLKRL